MTESWGAAIAQSSDLKCGWTEGSPGVVVVGGVVTREGVDWDAENGAVIVEGVVALADAESKKDWVKENGAVIVEGVVALAEAESEKGVVIVGE